MPISNPVYGTAVQNGVATSISVPYPDSPAENDLLVFFVSSGSGTLPTVPSGWTLIKTSQSGSNQSPSTLIAYKWSTGTETGTLTVTTPNVTSKAVMIKVSGVDLANPVDSDATAVMFGATGVYTNTGVTTTIPNTLLLIHSTTNTNNGTYTPPTTQGGGWTEEVEFTGASSPSIGSHWLIWSGSGATGNVNVVRSTSTRGNNILFALRPATSSLVTKEASDFGALAVSETTDLVKTDAGPEPSFVGVSSNALVSGSTSISVDLPVATQPGDFIALFHHVGASGDTITTPAGYNLLAYENGISGVGSSFFWKIAGASDSGGTVTVQSGSSRKHSVIAAVYRNIDSANPINGYAKTFNGFSTPPTTPTYSPTGMSVELSFAADSRLANVPQTLAWTMPAPITERAEVASAEGSGATSMVFGDNITPTSSTMGNRAITKDQNASNSSWTVALNPGTSTPLPESALVDYRWGGAPTASGGIVSVHSTYANLVRLKVADDAGMTTNVRYTTSVIPDANGWSKHIITSMNPNTVAYWQVETTNSANTIVVQPEVGRMKSLPAVGAQTSFTFSTASCFGHNSPGRTDIAFTGLKDKKSPLFSVITGDLGYYDEASDQVADHRQHYFDIKAAFPAMQNLLDEVPTLYIKSDHDSGPADNNPGVWTDPNRVAYKQVVPHYGLSNPDGLYTSFVVGRVRFILTDARYLRDPRADTDDANKSMLGEVQKQWLKDRLVDNGEFKVWIHEGEWVGQGWSDGVDPYAISTDGWARYTTERAEIGNFIASNGLSNKVFYISGNGHHLSADNGTNNQWGAFPSAVAAPGHRDTNITGGPWSAGTYIRGPEGSVVQQYATVSITDNGSSIDVLYEGWDAADDAAPKITMLHTANMVSQSTVAGTDTSALSVTETSALFKTVQASDTVSLSVAETISAAKSLPANDTGALAVSEVAAIAKSSARTDTGSIAVTETTALTKFIASQDAIALSVADTSSTAIAVNATDTGSLGVNESTSSFRTLSATDVAALTATETSAMLSNNGLPGTDSAALGVVESTNINANNASNDASALSVVETASIKVDISAEDSGALSATDSSTIAAVGAESAADTGSIAVSETTSTLVKISASDSAALSVVETHARYVNLSASDSGGIRVTESRTQQATLTATDTLTISVVDSGDQTSANTESAVDSASIAVSETATVFVTLSSTDTIQIGVTESVTQDGSRPGSDALRFDLIESESIEVTFESNDAASLSVIESAEVLRIVEASDTLRINLSETRQVGKAESENTQVLVYLTGAWRTGTVVEFRNGVWTAKTVYARQNGEWKTS